MTPAQLAALADPEADAVVNAAFSDPDAPTIYAEMLTTVDHGKMTVASLLDLLDSLHAVPAPEHEGGAP